MEGHFYGGSKMRIRKEEFSCASPTKHHVLVPLRFTSRSSSTKIVLVQGVASCLWSSLAQPHTVVVGITMGDDLSS